MVDNRKFHVDLFVLNHCGFDVILCMNWLSVSLAMIDGDKRAIVFQNSNQLKFEFY